jgi:DNA-binding MarR family transcriptional regulator
VKVTDAGRELLRTTEPLAKRIDRRVLDALPAHRREEFVTALASIIGKLARTAPA